VRKPVRRHQEVAEHRALVMRILPTIRVGDVDVSGKTGLGAVAGRSVGWIVGYAERGDHTWIYATHVDAPESDMKRLIPLRRELTHALLARYGVVRTSASP
jgi:beta-lactamase class D